VGRLLRHLAPGASASSSAPQSNNQSPDRTITVVPKHHDGNAGPDSRADQLSRQTPGVHAPGFVVLQRGLSWGYVVQLELSHPSMSSKRVVITLALLLPMPLRATAQDLSAFSLQAQRCGTSGSAPLCRAALEQSHRLKSWAEGRKLWRCYTALLGAEAVMIAAAFNPASQTKPIDPLRELSALCGQ